MIPQLDDNGLLPIGVWDCTLDEIEARFVWNPHRRQLWTGMVDFIVNECAPLASSFPIWIDGSFTRSKPHPEDIDVVLDVTDLPQEVALPYLLRLRIRSAEIKAQYHLDVWPRHPLWPTDLGAFFQYVGDKAAAELSLEPKDKKGILRVTL